MCRHCWQPIQFFQLPLKLPTPMSLELQIFVAFCKQKTLSFQATFANWFRFIFSRLKAWKLLHRYLNCHDLLIDILIGTYLWFIIKWLEWFFELWPFAYSYFDCTTWFLFDWEGIEHVNLWVIFDFIRVMVDLVLYDVILIIS